jgi:hypothetical protein
VATTDRLFADSLVITTQPIRIRVYPSADPLGEVLNTLA